MTAGSGTQCRADRTGAAGASAALQGKINRWIKDGWANEVSAIITVAAGLDDDHDDDSESDAALSE